MRRLEPLWVLLAYVAASLLLIGRFLLADPVGAVVGRYGADQGFFIWSLTHWLNVVQGAGAPFATDRIDAPVGFNLAWATTIPGPALLLTPITALAGPVASYNVLALLAPALAAWTAYLLCRHLTGDTVAAIAGGWLFGFSSYLLSQTLNHLNLALVFPLPLAALLAIRLVDGSLAPRRGVPLLALVIAAQYAIFLEVAATGTVLGVVALLVALVAAGPSLRDRILGALPSLALAYGIALVLVSPLLVPAFLRTNPIGNRIFPELYPLDALNPFVPTTITWLGGEAFADVARRFAGNLTEQTGYVGLLLLVIAAWALLERRHEASGRILAAVALVAAILALGGRLMIGGVPTIPLPWRIAEELPLISLAIPARIFVYTALAIAVATALWLTRGRRPLRLALVVLAAITLLPVQDGTYWRTPLDLPPGIADGTATAAIPDDAVVLILPYGPRGSGMLWHAQDRLRWRQAGSYSAAAIPAAYADFPIIADLLRDEISVDSGPELLRFLDYTGTEVILLPDAEPGSWGQLLNELGLEYRSEGGVRIYQVDPALRAAAGDPAVANE